jgi:hypothetical protein
MRAAMPHVAVLLLLALVSGCLVPPSGDDAEEAMRIGNVLRERYPFPVTSKMDPTRPAVGARPTASSTVVHVIGVVTRAEQDGVLRVVRELRRTHATKPILVRFFREERLTLRHDATTGQVTGGSREDIDLLRTERVD